MPSSGQWRRHNHLYCCGVISLTWLGVSVLVLGESDGLRLLDHSCQFEQLGETKRRTSSGQHDKRIDGKKHSSTRREGRSVAPHHRGSRRDPRPSSDGKSPVGTPRRAMRTSSSFRTKRGAKSRVRFRILARASIGSPMSDASVPSAVWTGNPNPHILVACLPLPREPQAAKRLDPVLFVQCELRPKSICQLEAYDSEELQFVVSIVEEPNQWTVRRAIGY